MKQKGRQPNPDTNISRVLTIDKGDKNEKTSEMNPVFIHFFNVHKQFLVSIVKKGGGVTNLIASVFP